MSQLEAKNKVKQRSAGDLIYFGKTISADTFYLPTPPFHHRVAKLLIDKAIKKGLIEAPRGTAKSSLAIKSVHHHYLYENSEMDSVIVIQSKTQKEAKKRLWTIKNTIKYNKFYRDLYGKHSDSDLDSDGNRMADTWQKDYVKFRVMNADGKTFRWVTISAIGTGQQVRGNLEDDTRVTYYLLDDPEDETNTATEDIMDSNYDSFLAGVATLDKRLSYVRVIGTPIVQGCLVDRIMTNPTGWAVQWYSAKCDMDGNPGLLWEEMYDEQELDEIKADLESKHKLRHYYADYECTVKGGGEGFFKEEYLQYWNGKVEFNDGDAYLKIISRGDKLDEMLELSVPEIRPVNLFIGVDAASSTSDRADFTVIMPVAVDSFRNIYVLPYFRKRVPSTVVVDTLIAYAKMYKPKRVHVESNQYQTLLREIVKQRLEDEENVYMSGLETKYIAIGDKEERLEILHPFFAGRKVYFHPDTYEFIKELIMFGTKRGHDDTLDAFYWATRKLILPDHTVEKLTPMLMDEDEMMLRYREKYGIREKVKKQTELMAIM